MTITELSKIADCDITTILDVAESLNIKGFSTFNYFEYSYSQARRILKVIFKSEILTFESKMNKN